MRPWRPVAAAIGAGIGLAIAEAVLAATRSDPDGSPPAIHSTVRIAATRQAVWDVLADVEAQPEWMHDVKALRIISPGPPGLGTLAEADVRILGIGTRDLVEISAWEAPERYVIRHLGLVKGRGEILLAEDETPDETLVTWREWLSFPIAPHLAAAAMRPILRRIFQADIERLRDVVEDRHASGRA